MCSRSVADEVVVQAVQEATVRRAVVVAFAQYLHDRTEVRTTEPRSQDPARRFWAALSPFGDAVGPIRVAAALEALTAHAPHHVCPITD